jgi:hypothetical protein
MDLGVNITGASGAIPVSDVKRRNRHASLFYEEVRKRTTDIERIAKNIGWDESKVAKIKQHVFYDTHDLGYDEPVRFDPDYDMAVSWQRLVDGENIQPEDMLLLEHEYLELTLMQNQGMSYNEAHIKASEQYDYAAAIKAREAQL